MPEFITDNPTLNLTLALTHLAITIALYLIHQITKNEKKWETTKHQNAPKAKHAETTQCYAVEHAYKKNWKSQQLILLPGRRGQRKLFQILNA